MIYIGSNKKLICRDGNEQYAKSMDLEFKDYSYLSTNPDNVIIDISAGWTNEVGMRFIAGYIANHSGIIYVRLVDQYDHQKSSLAYSELIELYKKYSYKIRIIGTYHADYYGMKVDLVLPYPYLEEECRYNPWDARSDKMIITGSDIESIYPKRCQLYKYCDNGSKYIDRLNHPGYSGKHWSTGVIGNDYLDLLSKYKYMVCTTCTEGYELLKYIECAEVGCICVGEVPEGLRGSIAEDWIIKMPDFDDQKSFDKWASDYLPKLSESHSINYRESLRKLRNKNKLVKELYEFIESQKVREL